MAHVGMSAPWLERMLCCLSKIAGNNSRDAYEGYPPPLHIVPIHSAQCFAKVTFPVHDDYTQEA